jgi:methionyl aminopeptidase
VEPPVRLKSEAEIACIRRSCRAASSILRELEGLLAPGVTTADLDRAAARRMRALQVRTAVAEGFPGSICVSVNEVAAHGVPGERRLEAGDLVSIDVSVLLDGWCGDAASTYAVGELRAEGLRVWAAARSALAVAVAAVRARRHLGDVGAAVLREASRHGCVVISELVGHGIGRSLHEEPEVFHTGLPGEGPAIVPGMVLTVEPALSLGSGRVRTGEDGWSLQVEDGAAVAQFEHTLAVFPDHTEVLTRLLP